MKTSLALLWATAATVGLLVVGCNKNTNGPNEEAPPSGITDEQTSMKVQAENDEFVKNDELTFSDQAIAATDYAYVAGQIDATITPLRWGRFITSVTRRDSLFVQPGDTIAIVRVHKTITGTLKIRGIGGVGDTVTVTKPFRDESDRNVLLKRVAREARRYWLNWVPVASSMVKGDTPANDDINITQVELISNGNTVTITNPLEFYLRYRWLGLFNRGNGEVPVFAARDSVLVRVTLTSTSPDTDLVALRFGFNSLYKNRAKMNLVSQNGSTKIYARSFFVHPRPGFFNVGIEAATKATLYDDSPSAYSVSWWGVPYRVF